MDFLKAQYARLQEQLSGLTTSQKMLAGALAVILVMTLAWWGAYAGRAEMEVLLDQPMTADQLGAIRAHLAGRGIDARVVGDRIQVPADRRLDAMADLSIAALLPHDTRNAFDEMIKAANPFWSTRMQDAAFLQAKQAVLGNVVRRFPGVAHATVVIDATRERGMGGAQPKAMVNMELRPGSKLDPRVVEAAVDLVCGAVAKLDRPNVRVIVNGVSQRFRGRDRGGDDDGGHPSLMDAGDGWMALVQKAEAFYTEKVREHFAFLDGAAMVSVNVRVNAERVKRLQRKVDPKGAVSTPVREKTITEETVNARGAAGDEPGVGINVPMVAGTAASTAGAAAPGESNRGTTESTEIDYLARIGDEEVASFNPGGDSSVTHASILLPRSYFVRVYQAQTRTAGKEPDDATLQAFAAQQLARWRDQVKGMLGIESAANVNVDLYTDLLPEIAQAPAAAGAGLTLAVTSHAREIALGALAVVSLLMVSSLVRKGSPAASAAEPAAAAPPAKPARAPIVSIGSGEDVAGEVAEGDALLDAMEVDADAAKSQEMLKQVEDLVGTDPDAAASLVKRWLNK